MEGTIFCFQYSSAAPVAPAFAAVSGSSLASSCSAIRQRDDIEVNKMDNNGKLAGLPCIDLNS